MNFGLFSFQRWLWRLLVTATKSPRRGTASCWPRYLRSAVYPSLHCLRWALNTPPKGLSVAKAKAWRTGMVWKSQSCVLVVHLNGKRRALAWWEFLVLQVIPSQRDRWRTLLLHQHQHPHPYPTPTPTITPTPAPPPPLPHPSFPWHPFPSMSSLYRQGCRNFVFTILSIHFPPLTQMQRSFGYCCCCCCCVVFLGITLTLPLTSNVYFFSGHSRFWICFESHPRAETETLPQAKKASCCPAAG